MFSYLKNLPHVIHWNLTQTIYRHAYISKNIQFCLWTFSLLNVNGSKVFYRKLNILRDLMTLNLTNCPFQWVYTLVKNKYTKMYLKFIYFMLRLLQIHLHIYVRNKNTLQLYFWYTNRVYLKSAELEQLILCLKDWLCGSSVEVQLKIYWNIFDWAKVEPLQVSFRYALNILYLKTDIIHQSSSIVALKLNK